MLAGLAAVTAYLLSVLAAPGAHWPLWDVHVYWWGGQQAARGGALYAPGARYSFTYPPFAAALFSLAGHAPEGELAAVLTVASIGALAALCAQSLGLAGVRRRPETVFAVTALALLTWPVAYTLRLGEVNLIVAALVGADLLRRHDGHRGQGIATGLAAGIKLTPLIFVVYLLITGRVRAAATAAAAFAATIAVGTVLLPSPSRVFWLDGVFYNQNRIGDPANPSDQSLSGAMARLGGSLDPGGRWWVVAALLTGLAGITVAAWAHRRGRRLAGVTGCALTGLLVSPFSWTHHWVWAGPLLVALAAKAWQRRSACYALAAMTAAAVFARRTPLFWPGHPPGFVRLLEGDRYVLFGLAVLAGLAIVLVRERGELRRGAGADASGSRGRVRVVVTVGGHPEVREVAGSGGAGVGGSQPVGELARGGAVAGKSLSSSIQTVLADMPPGWRVTDATLGRGASARSPRAPPNRSSGHPPVPVRLLVPQRPDSLLASRSEPGRQRANQLVKARHGLGLRRPRPGRRSGIPTGPPSKAAIIATAAICLIAATFAPVLLTGRAAVGGTMGLTLAAGQLSERQYSCPGYPASAYLNIMSRLTSA